MGVYDTKEKEKVKEKEKEKGKRLLSAKGKKGKKGIEYAYTLSLSPHCGSPVHPPDGSDLTGMMHDTCHMIHPHRLPLRLIGYEAMRLRGYEPMTVLGFGADKPD